MLFSKSREYTPIRPFIIPGPCKRCFLREADLGKLSYSRTLYVSCLVCEGVRRQNVGDLSSVSPLFLWWDETDSCRSSVVCHMGYNCMSLVVWFGEDRKCSAVAVGSELLLGSSMVRRCF